MSATIYYLSDYARLRRRRHRAPAVEDDHRQQAIVTFGILIFAVVLIVVGVLLIDGIATVGRSNSDCLQSGRRVCGFFHSALIQERLQPRGVAEGSHMAVHHALFRAA